MILGAIFAGYVGFAWHLPVVLHLIVAVRRRHRRRRAVGRDRRLPQGAHRRPRGDHHDHAQLRRVQPAGLPLVREGLPAAAVRPGDLARRRRQRPLPHLLGSTLRLNAGLLVALAAAAGSGGCSTRSTLGFRLRAVGANQSAARTAGMSVERSYIIVMLLAGALAGLAGVTQILGTNSAITRDIDAGIGFDAITVALLGRANAGGHGAGRPAVRRAARRRRRRCSPAPAPRSTSCRSSSRSIVLFIAAPALIRAIFRLRRQRRRRRRDLAKGWNG